MKLKCKLKELMDSRELSQMRVAKETGLSMGTVGRLYRDQLNRADFETLEKLGDYFGCKSVSELLEFEQVSA